MYYGNDEEKKKHILNQIVTYRECASVIPYVKKVIQQMDGRVLNVKLKTALNEGKEGANIRFNYTFNFKRDHLELIYYPEHRGAFHYITIAWVKLNKEEGKQQRIIAKDIIKELNDNYVKFTTKAVEMEEALNNIDTIREQLKQAWNVINAILKPIPYEVRDVYDLK